MSQDYFHIEYDNGYGAPSAIEYWHSCPVPSLIGGHRYEHFPDGETGDETCTRRFMFHMWHVQEVCAEGRRLRSEISRRKVNPIPTRQPFASATVITWNPYALRQPESFKAIREDLNVKSVVVLDMRGFSNVEKPLHISFNEQLTPELIAERVAREQRRKEIMERKRLEKLTGVKSTDADELD